MKTHREKCVRISGCFLFIAIFLFFLSLIFLKQRINLITVILLMTMFVSLCNMLSFSISLNDLQERDDLFVVQNSVRKIIFTDQDVQVLGAWFGKTRDGLLYRYDGVIQLCFTEKSNLHTLYIDLTQENYRVLIKLIQTAKKNYVSLEDLCKAISTSSISSGWNLTLPE